MSQGKSSTIYDIASLAKVSPTTVSRVLTQSAHPVSLDVKERILQAAKELNYIPNAQARYLKTQNNPSVGILIPSIVNPFYPSMVRGMADAAAERNYSIYLSNCDREYALTDRQVQNMLELNVNGIISVYLDTTTPSLANFINRGGVLVSLTCNRVCFEGAHNFCVDKIKETRIAMEHLLGLGHKRIALFMDEMNCQIRLDKVESYETTLRLAGIQPRHDYEYIFGTDCGMTGLTKGMTDADRGEIFVESFLERSPECTAILCMNDIMALGVCAALRERGYRVPEDLSVMGYDDAFFSAFCHPKLSTVAVPRYNWGQSLMRYMLDTLGTVSENKGAMFSDEQLDPIYLISRESTAQPRQGELAPARA